MNTVSLGRISVDVLLCTFRRESVVDTLRSLCRQKLRSEVDLRIIVADNDTTPSARDRVELVQWETDLDIVYLHAPDRNISLARNACLEAATAQWIAFIDDDETAPTDWVETLLSEAERTGADAVIAPSHAIYERDTPAWVVNGNYHSNLPVRRNGQVTTGHTCNALVRWSETPWADVRFDISRGRSGGEDTVFFFEIRSKGAKLDATDLAVVTEPVDPKRLKVSWILRRKFRAGQSYSASATVFLDRLALLIAASAKTLICVVMSVLFAWSSERRNFWLFRGALHSGVVAGCLSLPEPKSYGG